jgi:hypothetical protein
VRRLHAPLFAAILTLILATMSSGAAAIFQPWQVNGMCPFGIFRGAEDPDPTADQVQLHYDFVFPVDGNLPVAADADRREMSIAQVTFGTFTVMVDSDSPGNVTLVRKEGGEPSEVSPGGQEDLVLGDIVFHQNAAFSYTNTSGEIGHILLTVFVPREIYHGEVDEARGNQRALHHEEFCIWCLIFGGDMGTPQSKSQGHAISDPMGKRLPALMCGGG